VLLFQGKDYVEIKNFVLKSIRVRSWHKMAPSRAWVSEPDSVREGDAKLVRQGQVR